MKNPSKTIGKTIKDIRIGLGFSLEKLAEELDVDVRTIGRWEKGEFEPKLKDLIHIIDIIKKENQDMLFQLPDYINKINKLTELDIKEFLKTLEPTFQNMSEKNGIIWIGFGTLLD